MSVETPAQRLARARWALLFGNFAIGCGVLVVPGTLNDLASSLAVSVSLAGQLITIGAAVMCFGAPLMAGWVSGFDRRRLLVLSLLWFGVGHLLCALAWNYAALWPLRALTVLAAAVFTPQAAATVGFLAPPEQRGRAITFVFLGWSMASVAGLPLASWLSEAFGWRTAFGAVSGLAALAALWLYATLPGGVKPPALSVRAWKDVLTHPVLMAMVAITALQAAGQFTVFSYFAPYYKDVLSAGGSQIAFIFGWFGAFGLLGNVLVSRAIDRAGAGIVVTFVTTLIAASLLLWPLAIGPMSMALVLVPWGLGCFAANSSQQARLTHAEPAMAPALMALNTSAIYFGQAIGAASGGWLVAHTGYGTLNWAGLGWVVAAIGLSVWVGRQTLRRL